MLGPAVVAACADHESAGRDARAEAGPRIVQLSETRLEENDSAFIGRGSGFAASPSGLLAVGDAASSRVLVFEPDGALYAVVAKKGEGPGELLASSTVAFASDSLLAVADENQRRMTAYRVRRGAAQVDEIIRYDGDASALRADSDTSFVLGFRSVKTRTALARWNVKHGRMTPFLDAPSELMGKGLVASGLFQAYAVPLHSGALVAFAGTPYAVMLDTAMRTVRDTLWVPATQRRGIGPDLDAQLLAAFPSIPKVVALFSSLQAVAPLASGLVAFVHLDVTGRGRRVFNRAAWVSLLDVGRRQACVDGSVDVGEESLARFTFHGDTLLVFEQRTVANGAVSVVRLFAVDTLGCVWRPAFGNVRTVSKPKAR